MNYKIKEIHIVLLAILFLFFVNIFMNNKNNNVEGFVHTGHYRKNHHRRSRYYRNYEYIDWYDWNYWLYYINPFYPPQQVDLPFEGKDGGISWYTPWSGNIYNY